MVRLSHETSEYDMFFCVIVLFGSPAGVCIWDVFAWADEVVVCLRVEAYGVFSVEAVAHCKVKDSG
jgi:hypothetical protein